MVEDFNPYESQPTEKISAGLPDDEVKAAEVSEGLNAIYPDTAEATSPIEAEQPKTSELDTLLQEIEKLREENAKLQKRLAVAEEVKPLPQDGFEYVFIVSKGIDTVQKNHLGKPRRFVSVNINGQETSVLCDEQTEVRHEVAEVLNELIKKQKGEATVFTIPQV